MSDAPFPVRPSEDARRTDENLVETLREMIETDETISARAVARRMRTTHQPSTLTRDPWRMAQIAEHQAAQLEIRAHASPPEDRYGGTILSDIWNTLSDLRALRYFVGVARVANFSSAARELAVSQPNLTRQIKRLEEELGTELFVRHGRGVTQTRQGAQLFELLKTVQHLLTPTLEQRLNPGSSARGVTLAVPAEAGLLLVQTFVEQFRARWPRTTLHIQEGLSAEIEEWIVSHRVDIALMEDPPALDDINIKPVLAARLGLVAPPAFASAADPQPLRFRELAKIPLILPSQQLRIRRRVDRAAFQHGLHLAPVVEVDSLPLRKAIVRRGLGCTILPFIAIRDEIARGALLFREIGQPSLVSTYSIASQAASGPVINELVDAVREAVISVVERGAWAGVRVITSALAPRGE